MKNLLERAKKLIGLWPDLWAIPVSLVAFALSYYILLWIDPTSGVFDIGYLQALFLTAISMVVINALIFLGIQFNWKFIWKTYKTSILETDWSQLTPWQRTLITLLVYFLYFLFGVVILTGLI